MKETDPRHMPPNYYFDQIDRLAALQARRTWDTVELRPQTLCGFAPGTPMSLLPALAVYAAVSKELGQPLRFPGKPGAFSTLYQVTESSHFADAALWAALEPRAANQAYNITNGDLFRWRHLWPVIADVFQMPVGDVQTVKLTDHMPALAPVWERMVVRHGLRAIPFDQLAAWPFADYVFAADWDVVSDVTKSRQHGFHAVVDSQDMFRRLLTRFRAERIVP
jgi:nucleoside-diphosphate-sugar epimerase